MAVLPESFVRGLVVAFILPAMHTSDGGGGSPEDREMFVALAKFESGYNTAAIGPKGEIGLWQIHPPSNLEALIKAGIVKNKEQLKEPTANARAAAFVWNSQGYTAWTTREQAANYLVDKGILKRLDTTDPYGPEWDIDFGPWDLIKDPAGIPGKVGNALPSIGGPLEAIGNLISKIIDPTFWKWVGLGALGVMLAIVSTIFFTDTGQTVAKGAATKGLA